MVVNLQERFLAIRTKTFGRKVPKRYCNVANCKAVNSKIALEGLHEKLVNYIYLEISFSTPSSSNFAYSCSMTGLLVSTVTLI